MKKILYFALAAFLVTSCITSEQQAKQRVAKLVKRFPGIADTIKTTKIDTIYSEKTVIAKISDEKSVSIAYEKIDSLIGLLESKDCKDSIIYRTVTKRIKENCTIEKLLGSDSKKYDSAYFHLEVYAKGNELFFINRTKNVQIKEKEKNVVSVPCPEVDFWDGFKMMWWLLLIGLIVGYLLRK